MLGQWHQRIVLGTGRLEYLCLFALGFVPILIAAIIGVGDDRTAPAELQAMCAAVPRALLEGDQLKGFYRSYNWMGYPLMLPAALWVVRHALRQTFGEAATSPLHLSQRRYAPIRKSVRPLSESGSTMIIILVANIAIHLVDGRDTFTRLLNGSPTCNGDLDWGLYAFYFHDLTTAKLVLLLTSTTLEQFIIAWFGLLVLVNFWRFNRAYLRAIYLRGRAGRVAAFRLDLEDPNHAFGLGPLAAILNRHLLVLSIVGGFFLISRYVNVDSVIVDKILLEAVAALKNILSLGGSTSSSTEPFEKLGELFVNSGQYMLAGLWLLLAWVTIVPAQVKLLPFKHVRAREGRVTYLEQFVTPKSPAGKLLATGKRTSVDKVAEAFRSHSFWPTGDVRAKERIFLATVVFWLLVFPIAPVTFHGVVAAVTIVVLSYGVAGIFLRYHNYRLRRIDPSLVDG